MTPERVVVDSSGWIEVLTDGGQADHVLALLADERSLVVPGEHGEAQAIQAAAQPSHSLQLPLAPSIILAAQQVAQGVRCQLKGGVKGLDQALHFPLIQSRRLKQRLQLRQGLAVVAEALLPADV